MANAIKTVMLTPEMFEAGTFGAAGKNKIASAPESYARVPLVFRATRIRCNSLLKIPYHLYKDDGKTAADERDEQDWPFQYPLRKLLWRTRAAGLLTGAGYILKRSNTVQVKEVQWLNPVTMRVDWDTTTKQPLFRQQIQGVAYGPWTLEQMVYLPEFTLRDDIGPGDCPASVALNSAQLAHSIMRMASTFFESGAMPVTVLSSESGFGTDTENVQTFFKRAMQGIANAYRVLAVRGSGIKIEKIQFPLSDLATPELREQARKDVALAFEIPVTLLDDDANYATAKEHKRSFYDETVIPDADVYAEELNAQLLHPIGLHLEFMPEEMDLYQEDERESMAAASTFADILGKVSNADELELVAGTVGIEYDEALAKKIFSDKEKRAAEVQAQTQPKPTDPTQDPAAQEPDPTANPNPFQPAKSALDLALDKWERKTLERIQKRGSERRFDFESADIPTALHYQIYNDLQRFTSNTVNVKSIFDAARRGQYATKIAAPAYGSDEHKARMSEFNRRADKHESAFVTALTALLQRQSASLTKRIRAGGALKANGLSPEDWYKTFIEMAQPLLVAAFKDAGIAALIALGNSKIDFDVSNPNVSAILLKQAQRFATEVNATTWDALKASLDEGIANGETLDSLAARVEQVMSDRIQSSAETIARTETVTVLNAGTQAAWQESGVVSGKVWLAALDDRTREAHAEAHGQTVGMDEAFNVDGEDLMYPGDPAGSAQNVINCRCSMTAVID